MAEAAANGDQRETQIQDADSTENKEENQGGDDGKKNGSPKPDSVPLGAKQDNHIVTAAKAAVDGLIAVIRVTEATVKAAKSSLPQASTDLDVVTDRMEKLLRATTT